MNFFADNHIIKKKKWKVIIMLKKFSVENFKGFKDKITLDIGTPSNYSFNSEIIENGCITKGIIYGINSCGKSNLGLAIFDIITHLTEKQKLLGSYDFYLNMSGGNLLQSLSSPSCSTDMKLYISIAKWM